MKKSRMSKVCAMAVSGLSVMPVGVFAVEASRHALEEIVVTSQKREQLLQDTPIAMSVLNGRQMQQLGVYSLPDMGTGLISSLRVKPIGNTPSNPVIMMRGIGPADVTEITRDGSVAIYLDGVYVARSQGLGMELADLERMEVLRGPQGSLFGRNAVGGAINLVSKKPTGEFGLNQTVTMGRYDELRSITRVNLPEVAGVSAKFDYMHSERDGYVENTAPGEADYAGFDKDGGKLSLHWQASDTVAVDYSYDLSDVETSQYYYQFYIDNIGVFGEERRRLKKTRAPAIPFDPTVSEQQGHTLTFSWALSEQLTVKSISAYRRLEEESGNNYNGVLYANGFSEIASLNHDQYSQELQLIGSGERVEWVAGLYYLKEDADKTLQTSFTLDIDVDTGVVTPLATPLLLAPRFIDSETETQAVFGQATWNPALLDDRLFLTLGGRYTEDERSASRLAADFSESHQDSENVDTTAVVEYRWHDSLAAYLKWSTAYKAGGVSTRSESFSPFAEEQAKTWELGVKSEFWDDRARINIAVFRSDYDDMQLDFIDPDDLAISETVNAGKTVEVDGFEVDLALAPLPGLVIALNYTYLDEDMPLQVNPLSVDPGDPDDPEMVQFYLPSAPQHAGALMLDYEFKPMRFGILSLHLDMTSTDHYDQAPLGVQRRDAYTLYNGRLTLSGIKLGEGAGTLRASLWAKNLTDEEYVISSFPIGEDPLFSLPQAFGDPRTFGIDITYNL